MGDPKGYGAAFDCSTDNIGLHLKNIFASGELVKDSVTEKSSATATDGKNYNTTFYNLDAIISVGYRVNSVRATQFRQWCTYVLRQFAIRGYVIDKKRMENGSFIGEDYFIIGKTKSTILGNEKFKNWDEGRWLLYLCWNNKIGGRMKDVPTDKILDFLLKMGFERVEIQGCNRGYLKKKKCIVKIDHNRLYAEYLRNTFYINKLTKEEFASFVYYMTLEYEQRKKLSHHLGWDPIGYFKNASRYENDQTRVKLKKLEVLNEIAALLKQFEV